MVRALVIDDEPRNVRILKNLLEEFCPEVTIEGEAGDVNTALTAIRHYKPDLVFLDIEMPYGNAFDLLDKLMPIHFEVIFITAFDTYTLKAFKYSALDYLLKPVDIEDLKAAVKRAIERLDGKNINLQLANLLGNLKNNQPGLQKIALPALDGIMFVHVTEIIRFEANGSYTDVHFDSTEKITVSKNIKEYEDILSPSIFCRVHNSHIINLNRVKKYHKGRGGYLVMDDGTNIEVSIRRRDEFLAKFGQ
jgi:two-component system, LytTR family, response regulator